MASHYPAISHSFIWREVEALRALGSQVATISIWRTPDEQLLTAADRAAAASTFAVLPRAWWKLALAHLCELISRPPAYLSTLVRAIRLAPPGMRGLLWQLFYFAEAMVVVRHCRREGIRHLHAQFADAATDVALLVATHGGRRWSWSMAVHGPVEFYNVDRSRLGRKIEAASFVQAISHFGRSQLLTLVDEQHWPKVEVVRCGVDPTVYSPNGAVRSGPGTLRVLCVGRLVHLKGQSLLIKAVKLLDEAGIAMELTLIGDGPKRNALEALASRLGVADRVNVLGSVGQDQIKRHYANSDVFCLPSFAEGVPVVLMEAMALQRPVIATRIMGIPELVEDGLHGSLIPPGDLDALVDALSAMASESTARLEAMGVAGRARVLERFDVRRSAVRLRDIFDALPARTEIARP